MSKYAENDEVFTELGLRFLGDEKAAGCDRCGKFGPAARWEREDGRTWFFCDSCIGEKLAALGSVANRAYLAALADADRNSDPMEGNG